MGSGQSHRIFGLLYEFRNSRRGNGAIIFSLALAPMIGLMGVAIDYSRAFNARTVLQMASDAAALAAAAQSDEGEDVQRSIAQDVFAANLANLDPQLSAKPTVTLNDSNATVTAAATVPTLMLGILRIKSVEVGVTSTAAKPQGEYPACVLALHESADEALALDGTADLKVTNCAAHANSRSDKALSANGSTTAVADAFCTVGGHEGYGFSPKPFNGCLTVRDPFEDLAEPDTSGCDHTNKTFKKGKHTAQPGIYCGGITLNSHARVNLSPGIYVIKDGPLTLRAHSALEGKVILFWLTGEDAVLDIRSHSNIDISAHTEATYAGIAIAQDPRSEDEEVSSIEGGGIVRVVGSIYLPTHLLKVGGRGVVGDDSSYMPLIASKFKFHGNSQININLNSTASGMPADLVPTVQTGMARLIK